MTPLKTPIFDFHQVISVLTTPLTTPTPSLVKTSLYDSAYDYDSDFDSESAYDSDSVAIENRFLSPGLTRIGV